MTLRGDPPALRGDRGDRTTTAFLMHGFWNGTDAQSKQTEMLQFFKDLGLAGAALILLGVFSQFGDQIGLTITGPLFG